MSMTEWSAGDDYDVPCGTGIGRGMLWRMAFLLLVCSTLLAGCGQDKRAPRPEPHAQQAAPEEPAFEDEGQPATTAAAPDAAPAAPADAAGEETPAPPPLRDDAEPAATSAAPVPYELRPRVSPSPAPAEAAPAEAATESYEEPSEGPIVGAPAPDEEPSAEMPQRYEYRIEEDPHLVHVFYATDRRPIADVAESANRSRNYLAAAIAGSLAVALLLGAVFFRRRAVLGVLALIAAGVAVQQWYYANLLTQRQERLAEQGSRVYGNDRHEVDGRYVLELGTCDVRIPPDHRVGHVESPSIWKLEFSEDPEKHVVLLDVQQKDSDVFFDELRERVHQSAAQEAFVFVHGYNVSFDDAVQRTAQIAFDLKFPGAPICYSWPSKGGFAEYTYDETNVTWTVTHLEKFLEDVRERSAARTVHLIAHSMGNRALLQALERMALRTAPEAPLFGEILLAAPDVDTSEFRDRFAPLAASIGRHVTLYASSNDYALQASTRVHGYTRAGLSGDYLCVTPGLETIDVSPIDTSLIGHSYYGDNPLMIRDMRALVELGRPASAREWLRQMLRSAGAPYWVFREDMVDEQVEPEL